MHSCGEQTTPAARPQARNTHPRSQSWPPRAARPWKGSGAMPYPASQTDSSPCRARRRAPYFAFRVPHRLLPSAFRLPPFGLSALRTRRLVQGEHAMLRVTTVTNFSRRKRRGHSSRTTALFINILDILYVEGWLINPPSPTGFGSRGIKSLGPRSRREFKKEPGSGSENNPCPAEQDAGNRTLDCDPKPTTECPHPETGNLEFGIWNLEFGIWNLES
jgi:hypothetical protein